MYSEMDVKFEMETARDFVGQYQTAIGSLREVTSHINSSYGALQSVSWSGEAEKSFFEKFNGTYAMWTRVIEQLEHTRQAVQKIETSTEPIQEGSNRLM